MVLTVREQLAADGTLLACGRTEDDTSRPFLVRLFADGRRDPSFATNGVKLDNGTNWGCSLSPDGGAFVGGSTFIDPRLRGFIAKVDATGNTTAVFGSAGIATFDLGGNQEYVEDLVFTDSSVLVVGRSDWNGFIARFDASGKLDPSFTLAGGVNWTGSARGFGITLSPGGMFLVVGGGVGSYAFGERYRTTGAFDPGFANVGLWVFDAPDGLSDTWARSAFVRADGEIAIAGSAAGKMALWRLDASGLPVPGFADNGTLLVDTSDGRDRDRFSGSHSHRRLGNGLDGLAAHARRRGRSLLRRRWHGEPRQLRRIPRPRRHARRPRLRAF